MRLLPTALLVALLAGPAAAPRAGEKDRPEARNIIVELKEKVLYGTVREQEEAVRELGSITDEKRLKDFEIPAFLLNVAVKSDYHPRVRGAATESLLRVMVFDPASARDKVVNTLAARLLDRTEPLYVRRAIADAFGGILKSSEPGDRNGIAALERLAKDRRDDPALIKSVFVSLGNLGHSESVMVIVLALDDPSIEIKGAALAALQRMFQRGVRVTNAGDLVRKLTAFVSDDRVDMNLRISAAGTLVGALQAVRGMNLADVARSLADLLEKTTDPKLAAAVIKVMYGVPDEASIAALDKAYTAFSAKTMAGPEYIEVRTAIAVAAGEYFHWLAKNGRTSIGQVGGELLVKVLTTEPLTNKRVIEAAAYSLGNMSDPKYDRRKAADALLETMTQAKTDAQLGAVIVKSLELISDKAVGEKAEDWKKWLETNRETLGPR